MKKIPTHSYLLILMQNLKSYNSNWSHQDIQKFNLLQIEFILDFIDWLTYGIYN